METTVKPIETAPQQEHFAMNRLKEAVKEISAGAKELPELRARLAQQADKNRQKAKSLHDELMTRKEKLLSALETCRLSLLEAGMAGPASYSRKLWLSVEKFPIMTPDYGKFAAVLRQFATSLSEGKVNASIIGRLMANVRLGYYPTDPAHIAQIKRGLSFPENRVNLFDPCCGCGHALRALGEGENCTTYGTELDRGRAEQAQDLLDRVGFGSYFHSRISHECFHLMLLNPPYLSLCGENGGKVRHEKRFLAESYDRLMPGGVLIYIIPYYRLTEDIARILCDNFSDLSVYRFSGAEYQRFHQIAVFGIRQKRINGAELVHTLTEKTLCPEDLPELSELPKGRYCLPAKPQEVPNFKGAQFNVRELQREMERAKPLIAYRQTQADGKRLRRPLLPFKADQIGLIGAAGEINGYVGEIAPHVLKGMVVKSAYHESEITETDRNGRPMKRQDTYTVTNKLIFTVLTQSGYRELSA